MQQPQQQPRSTPQTPRSIDTQPTIPRALGSSNTPSLLPRPSSFVANQDPVNSNPHSDSSTRGDTQQITHFGTPIHEEQGRNQTADLIYESPEIGDSRKNEEYTQQPGLQNPKQAPNTPPSNLQQISGFENPGDKTLPDSRSYKSSRSGHQTPTQADYQPIPGIEKFVLPQPVISSPKDGFANVDGTRNGANTNPEQEDSMQLLPPRSFSMPRSESSSNQPPVHASTPGTDPKDIAEEPEVSPRVSEDSNTAFGTADSGMSVSRPPSITDGPPRIGDSKTASHEERLWAGPPPASRDPATLLSPSSNDDALRGVMHDAERPVSPLGPTPIPREGHVRAPSSDSLPSRSTPAPSLSSPVVPQPPMTYGSSTQDQYGGPPQIPPQGPTSQDRPSENSLQAPVGQVRSRETSRLARDAGPSNRPRSFSRPFHDASLQDHPAFRHERQIEAAQVKQDFHHIYLPEPEGSQLTTPHQSAPRDSIHDVAPPPGPPPGWSPGIASPPEHPRETSRGRSAESRGADRNKSKRSSRSSTFFKTFSSPSKGDSGSDISRPRGQQGPDVAVPPERSEKKGKRQSVVRSMRGKAPDREQGNEVKGPDQTPTKPQAVPPATMQISNSIEESFHSGASPGKQSNKLHRASTAGPKDQPSGKKKRFSGLGVGDFLAPLRLWLIIYRVYSGALTKAKQIRNSNPCRVNHR